jgi:hypothetical protein
MRRGRVSKFRMFLSKALIRYFWTSLLCAVGPLLFLQSGKCVYGQGMKSFSNRLEGTAIEEHGNPDITLLGVHRNFEQFPRKTSLQVRFFLPEEGGGSRQVSIEAREIFDTKHYLMQAKQLNWTANSWDVFAPWPTEDMIDVLRLDPTNLAVLASYKDGNSQPVFMPVDVFAGSVVTIQSHYTVWFKSSRDIHSLEKTVTLQGHQTVLRTEQCRFPADCTLYPASSSHAIDIDLTGLPEGVYTLDLKGNIPNNSDKLHLSILIATI